MKSRRAHSMISRIDQRLTDQAREWLSVDATLVGQGADGTWLLFQEGMPPAPLGESRQEAKNSLWRMAEGLPPVEPKKPPVRVETVVTPSEITVSVTHLATGIQRTATAPPNVTSREVLEEVLVAQVSADASAA